MGATVIQTTADRMIRGRSYLVQEDGSAYELDAEQARLFRDIISHFSSDRQMMTTGEAARLLGVSAKTVARILDSGAMPFDRNGVTGHRMVAADDVLRFKHENERRRRDALEEMRDIAEEIGMYDIPASRIPTQTR